MQGEDQATNILWNVLKSGQSYRNIAYLMTSFPLGLLYFIMLITGISLGTGLAVIGVGIFLLWGLFGLSTVIANFERWVSNQLLQTDLPMREGGVFELNSGDNWRSVAYLALKFPLGLLTFIITTTVIAFVLGLITMPFTYNVEVSFIFARQIDTLWEALVSSAIGLALTPFALILLGKVALMWRNLNQSLLQTDRVYVGKKKHVSREAIEQDVIDRLIDKGIITEETLIEEKRKNRSYSK